MVVVLLAARVLAADTNPVLTELLTKGVPLDVGPPVKLPELTMPDGLDEAAQQKRLASIADPNPNSVYSVEALIRKAIVAPQVLKVGGEKRSANCNVCSNRPMTPSPSGGSRN